MSNDIKNALQQAAKKKADSQQFVAAGRGDTHSVKVSSSKPTKTAKRTKSVTVYLHDQEFDTLLGYIESDSQLREFNRQQALRKLLMRDIIDV